MLGAHLKEVEGAEGVEPFWLVVEGVGEVGAEPGAFPLPPPHIRRRTSPPCS
jgi:hypothetical protein